MQQHFYYRELISFLFTAAIGTLLHFLFDLSGQFPPLGAISAVNESVWEHMKLLFVPMAAAAKLQSLLSGDGNKSFWSAKLLGIITGLALIPALYYTYTGGLGIHMTWMDISIFYVSAAAGYLVDILFVRCRAQRVCRWERIAQAAILVIALVFVLATFFPPKLPIFQDPVTGEYGIPRQETDHAAYSSIR